MGTITYTCPDCGLVAVVAGETFETVDKKHRRWPFCKAQSVLLITNEPKAVEMIRTKAVELDIPFDILFGVVCELARALDHDTAFRT